MTPPPGRLDRPAGVPAGAEEPPAGPCQVTDTAEVLQWLLRGAATPPGRVPVLAVDGRSGGGKTTTAARLAAAAGAATVVHTDDVAWHHSFFDWADLLRNGVLEPVHDGRLPVAYRPPAWNERNRKGCIAVPSSTRLLLVEGVGAARRELADLVDAVVWVQSDRSEARRRGLLRDGGDAAAEAFWDEWEAAEVPFLAEHRPWERAAVVVAGTPRMDHDPLTQLVTAPTPAEAARSSGPS